MTTFKEMVAVPPSHPDTPDGVGPHEGIELELMLAGTKPAAMFYGAIPDESYCIPEDEFAPYVASGQFIKKEAIYPLRIIPPHNPHITEIRYVFYALASEAWRVDELERLKADFWAVQKPDYTEMDIAIGRLLGYSEEQIAAFLAHQKRFRD